MGVNSYDVAFQAYAILNDIHEQATGQKSIAPTDYASFVSMAQSTLATGTETVYNAIEGVIARTLVAVRPYDAKFKGIEMSNERWGAVTRKISYVDAPALADPSYTLTDGQSVDPFTFRKPGILVMRYYGFDVYMQAWSRTEHQLEVAFSNEGELLAFVNGMTLHYSNQFEQWFENLKRGALANMILAKGQADSANVINLLTEYNTLTGQTLTKADVYKPANVRPFFQYVYSRMEEVSQLLTERSAKFHMNVTGKTVMRHTPKELQRIYIRSGALAQINAMAEANTYHPQDFLSLGDVEGVSFWQNINSPDQVQGKPVYINASGATVEDDTNRTQADVLAVMFDRDAVGVNIALNKFEPAIYNPTGGYFNLVHRARVQYQNDLTENFVVFKLA